MRPSALQRELSEPHVVSEVASNQTTAVGRGPFEVLLVGRRTQARLDSRGGVEPACAAKLSDHGRNVLVEVQLHARQGGRVAGNSLQIRSGVQHAFSPTSASTSEVNSA